MRFRSAAVLGVCSLIVSVTAFGQTQTYGLHEKALERIDRAQNLDGLSYSTAFGERFDLFSGGVEFSNTDISIPGNDSLPVELKRTYSIQDRRETSSPLGRAGYLGGFGEWDIDIPHIKGTFSTVSGWVVAGPNPNNRCSAPTAPPTIGFFQSFDYWRGNSLHIPGSGDQAMLVNPSSAIPAPVNGVVYPWITKDMWRISCSTSTGNGYPGEGFVATSPEGVRYFFDWVVTRSESSVRSTFGIDGGSSLSRAAIYFLVSKIEDRFGNWVNYSYSGDKLQAIQSSDGRQITLTYSGDQVVSASSSVGTRGYSYLGGRLAQVTLPDGSTWVYAATGKLYAHSEPIVPIEDTVNDCPEFSDNQPTGSFTYTVANPAGAIANYSFAIRRHYRHNVPKICVKPSVSYEYLQIPNYQDSFTLLTKTVSGPGLPTLAWTYTYGFGSSIAFASLCASGTSPFCSPTKIRQVSAPGGIYERHTFGALYGVNEGQLLKREIGTGPTDVLRTEVNSFVLESELSSHPFPNAVGNNLLMYADSLRTRLLRPMKQSAVTQQGTAFTKRFDAYDSFARPVRITTYSAPAP